LSTKVITQTDNNQSFNVRVGDEIVIHLEESPTTGYRWALDNAVGDILVLQNDGFSPAGSGVGGGGERTFTFAAQKAGSSLVGFKLWREWEGNNSITNRFQIAINVN